MNLEGKNIGFAFTSVFYQFPKSILELKKIVNLKADVTPIMSFNSYYFNTKYENAKEFRNTIMEITHKNIIHTISEAEVIGKSKEFDILIVAPCSGNTIAKLAHNIIDTPVTMAVKSHLSTENPVVLAISSKNGLSDNAENIRKIT